MNTNKPLLLELEDIKCNLHSVVNTAIANNIPCYMLEMIIAGIHRTVSSQAAKEIEFLRAEEAKKQNEENKENTNEE